MGSFFVLVLLGALISSFFWSFQLIKFQEEEKKKRGLKQKLKRLFKRKKEDVQTLKYTGQQIKIFLISSIIACVISVIGIGMHQEPPAESQNETNANVAVNNNVVEEESKVEETENVVSNEIETDSTEENTTTNESTSDEKKEPVKQAISSQQTVSTSSIPAYSGKAYIAINNNVPYFTESDLTTTSYEHYSSLDSLGRCGVAVANIGKDIMPTGERGNIGSVKPTGWHTVKYDNVSGKYLYNRCHLIGYQLTAENANTRNLITGTRYLNIEGMLPFENMVADYIKETNNHVLYRVTPIFEGNNLLASGVQIEAKSVEDKGAGILFNVYCYNVQPDIVIDYATGSSYSALSSNSTSSNQTITSSTPTVEQEQPKQETIINTPTNNNTQTYILNTNTKKFHYSDCGSASRISEKNKGTHTGTRDELISQGYSPCGNCDP